MDMSTIYHLLSLVNLVAVTLCVLYAKKLYDSTRGAADFWLFLSAFIFSLGAYILFDFIENILTVTFESPIRAAQDMSITFAAIFALVSAIYVKKMFDEMTGE